MSSINFCLVIPVYQAEASILASLSSIVPQLLASDELIISDDCSLDQSVALSYQYLRDHCPCPFRIIRHKSKVGLPTLLNEAANITLKDYVLRHDADDIAFFNRVELQRDILSRDSSIDLLSSLKVNFSNYKNLHLISKEFKSNCTIPSSYQLEHICQHSLFYQNLVAHPTVAIKTSVLSKFLYNIKYQTAEDYDLWLRLSVANYRLVLFKAPLIFYYSPPYSSNKIKAQLLYSIRARFTNLSDAKRITYPHALAGILRDILILAKLVAFRHS